MTFSQCVMHINLDIVAENYMHLVEICSSSEVGAAVKANAYGLGVNEVAPVVLKSGCKHFFVANLEEGISLRKIVGANPNIYVLNGVFQDELEFFTQNSLIPILNNLEQVYIWKKHAVKLSQKLPCIIHIDTGMHRLGMSKEEFIELAVLSVKEFDILYLMSHLASSEEDDNPYNEFQFNKFVELTSKMPNIQKSLANSSGIFLDPKYHFHLTRPGAALYGLNPTPRNNNLLIKNPISLVAPIIHIHELLPGESLGYNCTYTNNTEKSCLIATIPLGYADGFPRLLSNKGALYINGIKVPIIGRISMDITVINVSLVPHTDLFLGQNVEIIGNNNNIEDIAKLAETNGYEILTRIGHRFKKIYTKSKILC